MPLPFHCSPPPHRRSATRSCDSLAAPHDLSGSSDDDRDADATATGRRPRDPNTTSKYTGNARRSSPTSLEAALQLRLLRALGRLKRTRTEDGARDSPKPEQPRIDEGACAAAGCEDDDSSMVKRVCTEYGAHDRRKSKQARIEESAAGAVDVDGYSDNGSENERGIDMDARKEFSLASNSSGVSRPPETVDSLEKDFIILEEKDPERLLTEIDELLTSAALSSLRGKGYSLTVPLRSRKDLVYKDGYEFAYKIGHSVTYDLTRKNLQKITALTCVLSVIAEAIREGITVTDRHVYNCYKDIFETRTVSDTMISGVCCMFGCTRSSLNVVSATKSLADKQSRGQKGKRGARRR